MGSVPISISAAVAVRVTWERSLNAVPGGTHRLLGIGPGQLRFPLGDVPASFQSLLDVFEAGIGMLFVRLVRVTIGRVEIFPAVTRVVIRLVHEILLPMSAEALDTIFTFHESSPCDVKRKGHR